MEHYLEDAAKALLKSLNHLDKAELTAYASKTTLQKLLEKHVDELAKITPEDHTESAAKTISKAVTTLEECIKELKEIYHKLDTTRSNIIEIISSVTPDDPEPIIEPGTWIRTDNNKWKKVD